MLTQQSCSTPCLQVQTPTTHTRGICWFGALTLIHLAISRPAWFQPQHSPGSSREELRIAQANLKNSLGRLISLADILQTEVWDVIAIQDPSLHLAYKRIPGYQVWFSTDRQLTEDDNPYLKTRGKNKASPAKAEKAKVKKAKIGLVAFYVSTHVLKRWRATRHRGTNYDLVATLMLPTDAGVMRISNVYNQYSNLDLDLFSLQCMSQSLTVILGDFNIPHPYSPKATSVSRRLGQLTQGAGMQCLTPEREITFSRSASLRYSSTIDLCFVSWDLAQRLRDMTAACQVLSLAGFRSDHRIVQTTLNVEPILSDDMHYIWRSVNEDRFREAMRIAFQPLEDYPLDTKEQIDCYIAKLLEIMLSVVNDHVKRRGLQHWARPKSAPDTLVQLLADESELYNKFCDTADDGDEEAWEEAHAKARHYSQCLKKIKFRAAAAGKEGEKSVHGRVRRAKRMDMPHQVPCLSNVRVGDKYIMDPEEQARAFAEAIWPVVYPVTERDQAMPDPSTGSRGRDGSGYTFEELTAKLAARRDKYKQNSWESEKIDYQLILEDGELLKIINGLPERKSALPDVLGNEAIKKRKDVCIPFLERCIKACLKLFYHPEAFKHSIALCCARQARRTMMIQRAGGPLSYCHL